MVFPTVPKPLVFKEFSRRKFLITRQNPMQTLGHGERVVHNPEWVGQGLELALCQFLAHVLGKAGACKHQPIPVLDLERGRSRREREAEGGHHAGKIFGKHTLQDVQVNIRLGQGLFLKKSVICFFSQMFASVIQKYPVLT